MLEQGYGVLSPRFGKAQARAAVPLLSALGLRLAIQPVDALPPDGVCDVSIRLRYLRNALKVTLTLERVLGVSGVNAATFDGPQGHIVGSLSPARAERLCVALRPMAGVYCAISEQQTALYDLFTERKLSVTDHAEIKRMLRLMGCGLGGFGDAVGLGLERPVLARLLRAFPGIGLIGIDRAFQRYELLVVGKGALSAREFADFMLSRPATQAIRPRDLMQALPLRLDSWLTRPAAKQFLADCGSIGIRAETRLLRGNGAMA